MKQSVRSVKKNYPALPYFLVFGLTFLLIFLFRNLLFCPFWTILGIPCPSCGFTRACAAVLHLQWKEAFAFHPMFWMIPLDFLLYGIYTFTTGRRKQIALSLLIGSVVLLLLVYCIRMLLLFPHTPPMNFNTENWLGWQPGFLLV